MGNFQGRKTVFIGGGRMGEAIFSGLLSSGSIKPENLTVMDGFEPRLKQLEETYHMRAMVSTEENLRSVLSEAEVVVFSVTPQMADRVLSQVAPMLEKGKHTVISIMGGVELKFLEKYIPDVAVVRVMPNTPALVHEGAAGIALGTNASEEDGGIALDIFNSVGIAYLLPESLIDPLTSVSGCGPAYAYLFIEALADGGVEMGLSRDMALKLAAQTLVGSGRMVLETGSHPGVLKDNVCSPGGATIAGVRTLEEKGLRGTVIDAVIAGVTRMKEVAENA